MRAIRVAPCVIVLVLLAGAPVPAADTWGASIQPADALRID
jgi:hypothetical protein